MASEIDLPEMRNAVVTAVGTDSYILTPGWHGEEGQANFLPPEVTAYLANALIFAFAGGLAAALKPAGVHLGKTVGKWATERFQAMMGSKDKLDDVSDASVEATIKELKEAAGKGGLIDSEHVKDIQTSLAATLEGAGVTADRAASIVETVKQQLLKRVT